MTTVDTRSPGAPKAIDEDRVGCGPLAALVAHQQPYANCVATDGRWQSLIEKGRDKNVPERAGFREGRGIRSVALLHNSLPAERAQRRLRDNNENRRRQLNIVNLIEPLPDNVKFHMREGKIQQNAREERFQRKSEQVSH